LKVPLECLKVVLQVGLWKPIRVGFH
jgi:hypothetical protein